jgi:hypothetical protein
MDSSLSIYMLKSSSDAHQPATKEENECRLINIEDQQYF